MFSFGSIQKAVLAIPPQEYSPGGANDTRQGGVQRDGKSQDQIRYRQKLSR